MTAYYNEIDPKAAAWLRELIRCGHIAAGDVDERSIEDVRPDDLRGYTQCHFFAGIGVWSYALRRAGWPDARPVWTGSCPCQPFSAAGKGEGFVDERHLWPHWHHLIRECRPPEVLGEQVASKDGLGWLDLVCSDLEGEGYAVGATDLCAAGVGAPHIRQRLWIVAHDLRLAASGLQHPAGLGRLERRAGADWRGTSGGRSPGGLADRDGGNARAERQQPGGEQRQQPEDGGVGGVGDDDDARLEGQRSGHQAASGWVGASGPTSAPGEFGGVADAASGGRQSCERIAGIRAANLGAGPAAVQRGALRPSGESSTGGPTNGFWRDADWLFCRDGKWRPVEPGTFPLAHGAAERLGRLRGYGNAIVAPAAQAFVEAYLESEADRHFRLTEAYDLSTDNGGIFG